MTREEAISHIKDVICENNTIKPNMVVFEQEKEALCMAIEALKAEPCEDAVSREDALLALTGEIPDGMTVEEYIARTGKRLRELPSVPITQHEGGTQHETDS